MVIFKKVADLQHYLSTKMSSSQPIGFVPTMGALHGGHISIINKAKANGNLVVCSIFVNPTQFNEKSDYDKYPITIDADMELLLKADCDVLFMPSVQEVYPDGTENTKTYDFGYLDTIMEGAKRPGHFKGVGQVVSRLLEIVQPQYLYLGQKDYQQCMVIRKLLDLMHFDKEVKLIICPTVREADGLAMSSRNRRLTEPQRLLAGTIYQCLISIQTKQKSAPFKTVQKECNDLLNEKGFIPEYVSLADARDLTLINDFDNDRPMVALIAAKIGDVRLIDNLLLN
jgi:pantoate--beta-alanine ligase